MPILSLPKLVYKHLYFTFSTNVERLFSTCDNNGINYSELSLTWTLFCTEYIKFYCNTGSFLDFILHARTL